MWWRSEVNCSFFLCLAAFRTRSSAWVTRTRLCARCVLCWSAFPLVPGLGSANSAAGRPALFVGFIATMPESDFSGSCISGYGSSPSRYGPSDYNRAYGRSRDLPVPATGASVHARVAFREVNNVGTRVHNAFAAQWLAYTLPYRRFAVILADDCARIGDDVGCYSFIAVDFHHIPLAGLPAHSLTLPPAGSLSRPRRPLSRGSGPSGYPAEPLVSYQINRQFSGWLLPPQVIRAFRAHCQLRTSRGRCAAARLSGA